MSARWGRGLLWSYLLQRRRYLLLLLRHLMLLLPLLFQPTLLLLHPLLLLTLLQSHLQLNRPRSHSSLPSPTQNRFPASGTTPPPSLNILTKKTKRGPMRIRRESRSTMMHCSALNLPTLHWMRSSCPTGLGWGWKMGGLGRI